MREKSPLQTYLGGVWDGNQAKPPSVASSRRQKQNDGSKRLLLCHLTRPILTGFRDYSLRRTAGSPRIAYHDGTTAGRMDKKVVSCTTGFCSPNPAKEGRYPSLDDGARSPIQPGWTLDLAQAGNFGCNQGNWCLAIV